MGSGFLCNLVERIDINYVSDCFGGAEIALHWSGRCGFEEAGTEFACEAEWLVTNTFLNAEPMQ